MKSKSPLVILLSPTFKTTGSPDWAGGFAVAAGGVFGGEVFAGAGEAEGFCPAADTTPRGKIRGTNPQSFARELTTFIPPSRSGACPFGPLFFYSTGTRFVAGEVHAVPLPSWTPCSPRVPFAAPCGLLLVYCGWLGRSNPLT